MNQQDREMFSLVWNYRLTKHRLDAASKEYDEVFGFYDVGMGPHAATAQRLVEAVAAHREAEDKLLQARARMKA